VLLVEDDPSILQTIRILLTRAGFDVHAVADGPIGVAAFTDRPFDVVILDVMLPTGDGFEVCRRIRETSVVPIIMLTARSGVADVVTGLEIGADDYITKPFEPLELIARVRAALRRMTANHDGQRHLTAGKISVDLQAVQATVSGHPIALTPTEFRLLAELVKHTGVVLTREDLLERVWGYDYLGDSRLVDMAVNRLRAKLRAADADPDHLVTVRGVGYRLES
jgi:two-component system response regulator MtrA